MHPARGLYTVHTTEGTARMAVAWVLRTQTRVQASAAAPGTGAGVVWTRIERPVDAPLVELAHAGGLQGHCWVNDDLTQVHRSTIIAKSPSSCATPWAWCSGMQMEGGFEELARQCHPTLNTGGPLASCPYRVQEHDHKAQGVVVVKDEAGGVGGEYLNRSLCMPIALIRW